MTPIPDLLIPWPTFWILLGLLVVLLAVTTLQLRTNDYDWLDLLMEGEPRKASLTKHILLGSFLLAVWLVIMRTLDHENKIPATVDTLLLGILGVFVLGRVGTQAVVGLSRRPAPLVNDAANVTIEPPPRK